MRRRALAVLASAAAVLAAAPDAVGPTRNARLDRWQIVGPGGGGTMRRPAISPHDPRVVVLGCDMTGAYLTVDGGASWRMFNLGSVPTAFAFDPKQPSVVYAGAAALYRSDDAGRTWRMVLPDPAKNTVERAIGDHGDRVIFTDDETYPGGGSVTVHAIAVDEDDPSRVFAALSASDSPVPGSKSAPTQLVGSTDGGRTWSHLGTFASERVFALRSDGAGRTIHAIAETGAYVGAAATLQHFPAPDGAHFTSGTLGRDPRSGLVLAFATLPLAGGAGAVARGVQASDDGGRTWHAANGALLEALRETGAGEDWGPAKGSRPSVGPIAVSSHFPLEAYVGLRGVVLPGRGEKRWNGIAKTTDGGKTWSVVHARGRPALDEPRRFVDRAACGGGRPLGMVRRALRPRGGAERPAPSRTRPTSSARTARRTAGGRGRR